MLHQLIAQITQELPATGTNTDHALVIQAAIAATVTLALAYMQYRTNTNNTTNSNKVADKITEVSTNVTIVADKVTDLTNTFNTTEQESNHRVTNMEITLDKTHTTTNKNTQLQLKTVALLANRLAYATGKPEDIQTAHDAQQEYQNYTNQTNNPQQPT